MPDAPATDVLPSIELNANDTAVTLSVLRRWTDRALAERKGQENDWREDLRTYNGTPRHKEKQFPWRGASNLVIPMKAIVVDSIVARMHSAIWDHDKLYRAAFEDPQVVESQSVFQDFIDTECRNHLKFEFTSSLWDFDSVLFGTGFIKGVWRDDRRLVKIPARDGSSEFREIFDYYGPSLMHTPIEDILVPGRTTAINGPERCQHITHISHLRWDQIKDRESKGYNVKALSNKVTKPDNHTLTVEVAPELKELRDKLVGIESIRQEGFEIFETWCYFPIHEFEKFPDRTVKIAGKSIKRDYAELVVTWHPKTNTILRVLENWNEIGWRPFFALPYIRRSSSIYGIGVGRAIDSMNEALDMIHNQRIDNATVANTRVWKARKAGGPPRGTTISPSKILYMDDTEALKPEQLGDVYPSSQSNELVLRGYIELRTGINDYNLGREDPTGRYSATATSTQLLLKEGTRKFDFIIRDWRQVYGEVATWLISQYKQYGYHYQDFIIYQLGPEKAQLLMLALDAQTDQPTFATYKFTLEVSSISDSKQARMESNMQLIQITEQIYSSLILLAGNITRGVDQQGIPFTPAQQIIAWDAIEAGLTLYNRILETLDIKDVENYTISKGTLQNAILSGAQQAAAEQAQNATLQLLGAGAPQPGKGGPNQPQPQPPARGGTRTPSQPRQGTSSPRPPNSPNTQQRGLQR